ncbi:MAG: imelysin family protein [Myxococcales bacterium]
MNAWPLDENYIDYVRDDATAGLINDTTNTPQLTTEVLKAANTAAGEEAISTGYHAIEFLLWGQDDEMPGLGAGKRPYTDYLEVGGTAENQARRKQYLSIVTDLLLSDLQEVAAQWDPSKSDNYQASFGVGSPEARKTAISDFLVSLGSMANAELSGERMTVAYKNRSQEDEHSCFSDTTASDLHGDGVGIQNLWLGRYGSMDGVGLDEVVKAVDPSLAAQMTADIETSVEKLQALVDLQNTGKPIDVVITSPEGGPERTAMLDAIKALKVVGSDVEKAAVALGLSVMLEKPSEEL